MLGEFLYGLSLKDVQTQPVLQRRVFYQTATVAAAAFNIFEPALPNDKAMVLQSLLVAGVGGGAQTVLDADLRIMDASGVAVLVQLIAKMTGTAANRRELYANDLNLLVMPNERVAATINFSAAAIANTYEFSGHGIMIPRGNLQLR